MIYFCILASRAFTATFQQQEFQLQGAIAFVRFSTNGKKLSALERDGGVFESWDLSSKKPVLSIHMGGRVRMAAYNSALREALVVRADYAPHGDDLSLVEAKESEGWTIHSRRVDGLSLVPDRTGNYFFFPNENGSTYVQPVETSKPPVTWPFKVARFGLDRYLKYAAVNTGDQITVISVPSGQVLYRTPWKDPDAQVEIDVESKKVVIVSHRQISVWNYGTNDVRFGKLKRESSGAVAILPGGRFVWIGDIFGGAHLLNLKDFSIWLIGGSAEMGSIYPTGAVDVSPDGTELAAGFQTGEVKVWRAQKGS